MLLDVGLTVGVGGLAPDAKTHADVNLSGGIVVGVLVPITRFAQAELKARAGSGREPVTADLAVTGNLTNRFYLRATASMTYADGTPAAGLSTGLLFGGGVRL